MTSPHGFHRIMATLTKTSNPYLADRLPLVGEITVHETDTRSRPMPSKVTFRIADASKLGGLGASVHVDDAEWHVSTRRCWNCFVGYVSTRPDESMQGMTDETVCLNCGAVQAEE